MPEEISERQELIERIVKFDANMVRALHMGRTPDWLNLEVTMSQMKVLYLMYASGPCSMSHLSGSLGVTLPTMTGIVDRLVEHQLAVREEDSHDRRLVIVRLTESGSSTVDRWYQAARARVSEILELLDLNELRIVAQAMDVLCRAALSYSNR